MLTSPSNDAGSSDKDRSSTPHLSISSHVVVQLGLELVTDVEQALLELAKNAYDADSPECEITVEPDWMPSDGDPISSHLNIFSKANSDNQVPVGRVLVRDYGLGLSPDAVTHGWLRISASLKRVTAAGAKQKTPKGRTPVGDKGLGRLATMKIGNILRLKTSQDGERQWRTISFSWSDFTPDRTLEQVQVVEGTEAKSEDDEAGTIIEIIGLHDRERWTNIANFERELIPNLSSLISPFRTQDNFKIAIKVGRTTYELDTLEEDVLNLASARFEFKWDGKTLSQNAWVAPSLFRGSTSPVDQKKYDIAFNQVNRENLLKFLCERPRLRGRNASASVPAPWLLQFDQESSFEKFPADRQFPGAVDPGPFEGTIHYFLFNKSTKEKLQQTGVSVPQLQAMANIAIYRDGFKIRAQRDWLRLSDSATSGGSYYELRPSNTIGFFALTNELNHGLVEKSDREGFVDNSELRGFMALTHRCKDYANSILEATRRSVNEFITTVVSQDDVPPSAEKLVRRLTEVDKTSKQNLEHAKQTLSSALSGLDHVKSTLATTGRVSASNEGPSLTTLLGNATGDLDRAAGAIVAIENSLKEYGATSNALQLVQRDDSEIATRLLEAAAVGLSARSLAHELHFYVNQLRGAIETLNQRNRELKDAVIRGAIRQLTSTTRELTKTVAAIDPLLPGSRSLKEKLSVRHLLEEYVASREASAASAEVRISYVPEEGADDLNIHFSRSRFLQIVENLYNNSFYWLRKGPLPDKTVREILVRSGPHGFSWADSGPGISPTLEASIFEPFVSGKLLGEGQGLGLHIVATFLEVERCSISLSDERNPLGRRYVFVIDLRPVSTSHKQPTLFKNNG